MRPVNQPYRSIDAHTHTHTHPYPQCHLCPRQMIAAAYPPPRGCRVVPCPLALVRQTRSRRFWEGLVCHGAQHEHWPLCLTDPSVFLSNSLPALKVNDSQLFPGHARRLRGGWTYNASFCRRLSCQSVTSVRTGTRGRSRHLQLDGPTRRQLLMENQTRAQLFIHRKCQALVQRTDLCEKLSNIIRNFNSFLTFYSRPI